MPIYIVYIYYLYILPEAQRNRAEPLLAKLMETADYKSNLTGGAEGFRRLLQEARSLAPPEKRARLNDVQAVYTYTFIDIGNIWAIYRRYIGNINIPY